MEKNYKLSHSSVDRVGHCIAFYSIAFISKHRQAIWTAHSPPEVEPTMMAARVAVLVNDIMTIVAVIIVIVAVVLVVAAEAEVEVEAAIGGTPMTMPTKTLDRGCLVRRSVTMAHAAIMMNNDGKMGLVTSNHAIIEVINSTGE